MGAGEGEEGQEPSLHAESFRAGGEEGVRSIEEITHVRAGSRGDFAFDGASPEDTGEPAMVGAP